MSGITMDELYELISHNHEAEFEYQGTTYVLQPEVKDKETYLVIWNCTPDNAHCIARYEVPPEGDIPREIIDNVLSEKCFDGKSFLEIEGAITVTVIY